MVVKKLIQSTLTPRSGCLLGEALFFLSFYFSKNIEVVIMNFNREQQ